jgi:hypothetical protein
MRKSTILLLSFVAIVIAFAAIREVVYPSAKSKNKYARSISQEYLDLFRPEMQKKFVASGILGTITMPSGISVSSIVYGYEENGNGRAYDIELFKIGLKEDNALDEVIRVKKVDRMEPTDTSFNSLMEGGFDLKLKPGKNEPVSTLEWSFNGDIFKPILKQDNLLYYEVRFNYFTLKFNNGTEFWAKRKPSIFLPLPSSGKFIFIKRKHALYMIFFIDIDSFLLKPNDVLKTINENLINPNGNNN